MGWASGSTLMNRIITVIQENVGDPDKRYYIYEGIVDAMQDADWDTLDECLGKDPEYDRLYQQMYGEDKEDEE